MVRGAGKDVSHLIFAAGKTGIEFAFYNGTVGQGFEVTDMSILTKDTTDTYAGIYAHASTSYYTQQSVVRNVMFRGFGYDPVSRGVSTVWLYGVELRMINDVLIDSSDFVGNFNSGTTRYGNGIDAATASGLTGTLEISNINTNDMNESINLGNNVQGVMITNSSLGGLVGVNVANGVTGLAEINISNVSFNLVAQNNTTGVSGSGKVAGLTVTNSEFAFAGGSFSGTQYGLALTDVEGCTIHGNAFAGQGTSSPSEVGISLNGATTGPGCTVMANTFEVLTTGVSMIGASNKGGYLGGNVFKANVTTACNNATSPPDLDWVLYGCYDAGQYVINTSVSAAVTYAVGTEVTVASTSGYTTGDVVAWGGIGGITYPSGVGPIKVIDGTHMALINCPFGGTYTSGGFVMLVP